MSQPQSIFAVPSRHVTGLALTLTLAAAACSGGGGGQGSGGTAGVGPATYLLAGGFGQQFSSNDLDEWTPVHGITGAYNSRGVAFGNGTYVWTGDCGAGCFASATASTSLSNPNYDQTQFGDSTVVYEVTFGNGAFVTVGSLLDDAMTWVSTDGVNWLSNPIPGYRVARRIVLAEGLFVTQALAQGAARDDILVSSDGVSWAPVVLAGARSICDVSHGNGQFLAIGFSAGDEPTSWASDDGVTWSDGQTMGNPFNAALCLGGAAYGNGVWVAVGSAAGVGRTWVAPDDGRFDWVERNLVTTNLQDVKFVDGRFIAVGDNGVVLTSVDGVSWTNTGITNGTGVRLYAIAVAR